MLQAYHTQYLCYVLHTYEMEQIECFDAMPHTQNENDTAQQQIRVEDDPSGHTTQTISSKWNK